MGFVEIAVWFMIFVVLSAAEIAISIFMNHLGDTATSEDWFGFFLMMILSCVALAIMIAYLLSTNGLI